MFTWIRRNKDLIKLSITPISFPPESDPGVGVEAGADASVEGRG
jgi:hypothetical protein